MRQPWINKVLFFFFFFNNAQLPPEGFGTHSIEPFASLKVRTTSLINILQGKACCQKGGRID